MSLFFMVRVRRPPLKGFGGEAALIGRKEELVNWDCRAKRDEGAQHYAPREVRTEVWCKEKCGR